MRVAIVETSPRGGLLHYGAQLADALAGRGHQVDLIATRGNELSGHPMRAAMRELLPPLGHASEVEAAGGVRGAARKAGTALWLLRVWSRIVREARRGGYDAVLLGDVALPPSALGALALTALPGGPAVAEVCHNVRDGRSSPITGRLLARFFQRADLVLVHGARSREEFEQTWPPARLAEIPHGDERLFGTEPPRPARGERILFFGNWRDVKGLPVLMDAFDLLVHRRPGARLTIAGRPFPDGRPDEVRAWAARHRGRVTLVDSYIPVEDVPALFGDARVVVTPYIAGNQSGVVHLAMTMARAVVASDVGDIGTTVVHGETGLVVPPSDPEALASALERVVADPALADRFGAAGLTRLDESSSWDEVAEIVERELAHVPGGNDSRPGVAAAGHAEAGG